MPAASDNPFDLVLPRRPSLADVGGASVQDDALYPPDPLTMPTAAMLNVVQKLVAQACAGMLPALKFQLTHGASPSVAAQWQMGASVVVLTAAKNGAGDYTVTWPADGFPTPIHRGTGWVVVSGAYCPVEVAPVANGVRCKVYDAAGAAADVDFVAAVW